MMVRFPRLKYCMCGVGLQSGTKAIAFFSLFGNIIGGFCRIVEWIFIKTTIDAGLIQDIACIGTSVLSFIVAICSILLFCGAFGSNRWLLVPWLITDMLLRCMHIIGLAYCIKLGDDYRNFDAYGFWTNLAIFFAICITFSLIWGTFFWSVVLSYFFELREKEMVVTQNVNHITLSELVVL